METELDMKHYIVVLTFIVLLFLGGCQAETTAVDDAALRPIRLPMGFIADPQYAPFYVAVEKGYYAEEGLEIEFDYSFETDGIQLVGANELPLAIVSGEQVLLGRAQGLPLVYVLEWFQEYPIAIVSKDSAGIEAPADLAGKTVGLPGFFGASYVGYVGLLSSTGLAPDDVVAEEIGFTQVEALRTDQVDAVVGYINNEPIQLEAQGEDVSVLPVADYVDLVANGIVANETVVADEPALVQGFVRATLRGLADTLADPDAAYEISKGFVEGLDDSRRPVLRASLPLWQGEPLGISDLASWEATQQVLLDAGLMDAPLADLNSVFTNEFVRAGQPND